MQNRRLWEGGPQPELAKIFECEVASRSLINTVNTFNGRVDEVGIEQGRSRSLVFVNSLWFIYKKQDWSTM
jgi:hypothetical protein